MLVTLFGISMFVSHLQPKNAALPIFVTLFGISTLVSKPQLLNAFSPILVIVVPFI